LTKVSILGASLALVLLAGTAGAQEPANGRQGANQAILNAGGSHRGDEGGGQFNQAVDDYNAKRYGQAASELKEYLKKDQRNIEAHKMLADSYLHQNKVAEAVPEMEAVVRLAPKDAAWRSNLGAAYLQTSQFDKAADIYQAERQRDPKDPEAAYDLGVVLVQAGKYPEAVAALRDAVTLKPTAPTYLQLGVALDRAGKNAEAATAFEAASGLDPRNAQAVLYAGMMYHESGNDVKAVPALQKALGVQDKFGAHMVLAEAFAHAGKTDAAIAEYALASTVKPDDFGATANRGVLNQNAGRKAEAEAAYRQALTLKAPTPEALAHVQADLAGLLAQDGRADEAVALLTQAGQNAPKNARYAGRLGQVYEKQGKKELAIAAYQKALMLDAHQQESVQGLARLK